MRDLVEREELQRLRNRDKQDYSKNVPGKAKDWLQRVNSTDWPGWSEFIFIHVKHLTLKLQSNEMPGLTG